MTILYAYMNLFDHNGDVGKGREILALQAPVPDQRITYHPYSAPLHRIKNENMLPVQLLTPFQARDGDIRHSLVVKEGFLSLNGKNRL